MKLGPRGRRDLDGHPISLQEPVRTSALVRFRSRIRLPPADTQNHHQFYRHNRLNRLCRGIGGGVSERTRLHLQRGWRCLGDRRSAQPEQIRTLDRLRQSLLRRGLSPSGLLLSQRIGPLPTPKVSRQSACPVRLQTTRKWLCVPRQSAAAAARVLHLH